MQETCFLSFLSFLRSQCLRRRVQSNSVALPHGIQSVVPRSRMSSFNDYSDYQPHQAELGHFICLNCLNLRLVKAARSFMETLPASFLAVHWRHGALPCNAMQSISGFILFETRSCSTLYFFLLHISLAFFSSISLW